MVDIWRRTILELAAFSHDQFHSACTTRNFVFLRLNFGTERVCRRRRLVASKPSLDGSNSITNLIFLLPGLLYILETFDRITPAATSLTTLAGAVQP